MKNIMMMGHALIFAAAMAFAGSISADSTCKGMDESSCSSNSNCVWVKGYSQKDGDKVKSYCRSRPGKNDSGKKHKKDKKEEMAKTDDAKSDVKEKKEKKKKERKSKKDDSAKDDSKKEKKERKSKKKKDKKDK